MSAVSPNWQIRDLPMKRKVVIGAALICLGATLFTGAMLFAFQVHTLRQQFQAQMDALAEVVANYAAAPITFEDKEGLESVLDTLHHRPEIRSAELRARDGSVVAREGAPIDETCLPSVKQGSHFHGWDLVAIAPVRVQDETIGRLLTVASFKPICMEALWSFLPALSLTGLLALAISIPASNLLGRLLLTQLARLAVVADEIARTGTFGLRAPPGANDEVGRLTTAFNRMLDQVQSSDEALRASNTHLAATIAERERLESALVESSRMAGMAEVATGVLHNVGNVLNSVNVSAQVVREQLTHSQLSSFGKMVKLLAPHVADPAPFYANDPKAKLLPRYLTELHQQLERERGKLTEEITALTRNIEHIKEVVTAQQSFARTASAIETLNPASLIEEAVQINQDTLVRHGVTLLDEIQPGLQITSDRHDLLQILVNLITNAVHAVKPNPEGERTLTLRLFAGTDHDVIYQVSDNGVGIAPENLNRIFQHGFTTRKDGHGFGLHSGALAARRLGGSLTVASGGIGQGASFTLRIPVTAPAAGTPSPVSANP